MRMDLSSAGSEIKRGICVAILLLIIAVTPAPAADDIDLRGALLQLEWRENWPAVSVQIPLHLYRQYLEYQRQPKPWVSYPAPVNSIVASTDYTARINGEQLDLEVRINLIIFRPHRMKPLPLLPA